MCIFITKTLKLQLSYAPSILWCRWHCLIFWSPIDDVIYGAYWCMISPAYAVGDAIPAGLLNWAPILMFPWARQLYLIRREFRVFFFFHRSLRSAPGSHGILASYSINRSELGIPCKLRSVLTFTLKDCCYNEPLKLEVFCFSAVPDYVHANMLVVVFRLSATWGYVHRCR
jgi:hypothetical protein